MDSRTSTLEAIVGPNGDDLVRIADLRCPVASQGRQLCAVRQLLAEALPVLRHHLVLEIVCTYLVDQLSRSWLFRLRAGPVHGDPRDGHGIPVANRLQPGRSMSGMQERILRRM